MGENERMVEINHDVHISTSDTSCDKYSGMAITIFSFSGIGDFSSVKVGGNKVSLTCDRFE